MSMRSNVFLSTEINLKIYITRIWR